MVEIGGMLREDFAETTMELLPAFINDAKALAEVIEQANDG